MNIETVQKSKSVVEYMCRLKVMNAFAFLRELKSVYTYLSQFGFKFSKIWCEKCRSCSPCNTRCCSHLSDGIMNHVHNKSLQQLSLVEFRFTLCFSTRFFKQAIDSWAEKPLMGWCCSSLYDLMMEHKQIWTTRKSRFLNVKTYSQNLSSNWKTKVYIYNSHTSASSCKITELIMIIFKFTPSSNIL